MFRFWWDSAKKFQNSKFNMADKKIIIDSKIAKKEATLNAELEKAIRKKAITYKEWRTEERENLVGVMVKLYKETVELARRENVAIETPSKKVKKEIEKVDKERAKQVNDICAKSEDHLLSTIKKRKIYPQKIKECLSQKNVALLEDLQNFEDKMAKENYSVAGGKSEFQLDMSECECSSARLKQSSEELCDLSKSLSETRGKFQQLIDATKLSRKMQGSEMDKILYSKGKLPSSFDSILKTPTKDHLVNDSVITSDKTSLEKWVDKEEQSSLRGLKRKGSPVRS